MTAATARNIISNTNRITMSFKSVFMPSKLLVLIMFISLRVMMNAIAYIMACDKTAGQYVPNREY